MAFEVIFNTGGAKVGLSNSDANKTAWNAFPNLVFKTVTETEFQDICDQKKLIDGFTGDTVDLSASPLDDERNTDGVVVFKQVFTSYVSDLKQRHTGFLNGNSNSFNSIVTASKTALDAINVDTVVAWTTNANGDDMFSGKYSPHQILREANSAILHITQIP